MPKRVLVVDDSIVIRRQCCDVLRQAGYEVVEAWDAYQARTALQKAEVAFMLCDLNLPGMGGLELIEAMRMDSRFISLPTAILTGERSPALVERAKRAGVKRWLLKPCKPDLLVDTVAEFAGAP